MSFVTVADGSSYHFIENQQMGHPNGLLATSTALFVTDLNFTGAMYGTVDGIAADRGGVVYRIVPVNDAPVLGGIVTSGLGYSVASGPLSLAPAATVADVDSATFGGGVLSVTLVAGGLASDRLSVIGEGTGAGQIGVSGSVVSYGGTAIGTVSGGTGTTALSIALNDSATAEAVQALLRRIVFSSVAADPTGGGASPTRTVRYSLSDAAVSAGGLATTVTQTITVGA